MHTFARQGIEVGRQRGHQGLALAGAHFGDAPLMQRDATDELHIEVAHLHDATGRLTHDRKSLGQQLVEGCPGPQTLAELDRLGTQGLVAQGLQGGLKLTGCPGQTSESAHDTFVAAAEKTRQ